MSQFKLMLSACRIPQRDRDSYETYKGSRHIAVAYQNHFYTVDITDANGQPLSVGAILSLRADFYHVHFCSSFAFMCLMSQIVLSFDFDKKYDGYSALEALVEATSSVGPGVGAITAAERNFAADAYKHLNLKNRSSVDAVNRAILVLCIENENPKSGDEVHRPPPFHCHSFGCADLDLTFYHACFISSLVLCCMVTARTGGLRSCRSSCFQMAEQD